jgi:hypothetical protein
VTTPDFLHYFGMADLSQLPPLEADMPAPPPVPADVVADGRPPISGADVTDEDTVPTLDLEASAGAAEPEHASRAGEG